MLPALASVAPTAAASTPVTAKAVAIIRTRGRGSFGTGCTGTPRARVEVGGWGRSLPSVPTRGIRGPSSTGGAGRAVEGERGGGRVRAAVAGLEPDGGRRAGAQRPVVAHAGGGHGTATLCPGRRPAVGELLVTGPGPADGPARHRRAPGGGGGGGGGGR